MNINLQCTELRNNIAQEINNSGLPITMVYYMMKDLMVELESVNNAVIAKERAEAQQNEKKELSE